MSYRRPEYSEQTLASIVIEHFEALGADVYQEVEVSGGVADIVAVVGPETWIIEVKRSLSLALIGQALDRRRLAHRVFIAAPQSRNVADVESVCAELGIGLLSIYAAECYMTPERRWYVVEKVPSRRWNSRPVALRAALKPEHKTHAQAGAVGGAGRWTPFRDTCEQLARLVRAEPGIHLKEAIGRIRHHYRSAAGARSSLAKWIVDGKVLGVRLRAGGVLTPPTTEELLSADEAPRA